jgi:hypothetical protein
MIKLVNVVIYGVFLQINDNVNIFNEDNFIKNNMLNIDTEKKSKYR